MIQGIDKFKEYFKDDMDNYVIIGGLATALIADDLGFLARATKDIDLVVISKDNEEFIKKLLRFVKEAQYKTKQRTKNDSKHNLFRFLDSEDKTYPEQLELFAIHDEDSQIITDKHIIPIETPEFYDYLSAILLDKDYFDLLVNHTANMDGLHIATAEVLIPLKIHAHLNLVGGIANYNGKHLNDVIRLISFLDGENKVELKGNPKRDFIEFLPIFEEVEEEKINNIFKSMKSSNFSKEDLVELLNYTYSE
ncbi:hypothetical protein N5U14_11745 [Aliarcobacter butzleri]|uniref:hypothetical protein n=1 Tax=Aliarcobacter butzleri TaxID=28197 RepID=UPI0021B48CF3|nr:hypothetical protein [Aliarcobacter butzleri]MCT7611509.1 hypothetical protein [Aliarcobacter butzleri]